MRLHADLHGWDLNTVLDAMPELSLPKQTAFKRKEVSAYVLCAYVISANRGPASSRLYIFAFWIF